MKLKKYLDIKERASTGEVFTPSELVREMISKLDESVFISDSTTFFIPGCGLGVFMEEVVKKLVEFGHSEENAKSRVIGIDIRVKYINYLKRRGYRVFLVDFLSKEFDQLIETEFGKNMKFDVVLGNPPYHSVASTGKSIAAGGTKLWMHFVNKSLLLLKDGGYMLKVHPIGWRQMHNKLWNKIYNKYQIHTSVLEPDVNWDVGVIVDYYVLQKIPYKTPTSIIYKDGTVDVIDFRSVNGLSSSKLATSIIEKMKGDTLVFYNKQTHHHTRKHMSKTKEDEFIYPIKHTGAQDNWWSTKKHEWQYKNKVIVSYTGYLSPFYDNGTLGTSQHSHVIFVDDECEGNYIIRLLNSNLYKFVIKAQKTSGFNDMKMLNTLPYPNKLGYDFTDAELYEHFGLTQEEIDYIEENVK